MVKELFDNAFVLEKMEEKKKMKKESIINQLKQITPSLNDDDLVNLYNKSISIHQSNIQGNGAFLEDEIMSKQFQEH